MHGWRITLPAAEFARGKPESMLFSVAIERRQRDQHQRNIAIGLVSRRRFADGAAVPQKVSE